MEYPKILLNQKHKLQQNVHNIYELSQDFLKTWFECFPSFTWFEIIQTVLKVSDH